MPSQSDRRKLFSETKVIIDNFLHDAHVGNEVHHFQLDDCIETFHKLLKTAAQLLCFRDQVVELGHDSNNIRSAANSKKTSVEGSKYNKGIQDVYATTAKVSWKRGTWEPTTG